MAKHITLTSSKLYATEENAVKAVQKRFPDCTFRFIIVNDKDGKFYPICLGPDALTAGTHFHFVTCA